MFSYVTVPWSGPSEVGSIVPGTRFPAWTQASGKRSARARATTCARARLALGALTVPHRDERVESLSTRALAAA